MTDVHDGRHGSTGCCLTIARFADSSERPAHTNSWSVWLRTPAHFYCALHVVKP